MKEFHTQSCFIVFVWGIVDKEPLAYGGYPHEAVVCLDYFSYFAADDDAELCGDVEV